MSRHRSLASVGVYDSHEALMADVAILRGSGIEPVASGLMDPDGTWRLEVDGPLVTPALIALGRDAAPDYPDTTYACPRCGSSRSATLPPYLVIGIAVCLAVGMGVSYLQQWRWLVVATLASMVVLHRLERAAHWRCLSCGHRWNHLVEQQRRAEARRREPE